MMLLPWKKHLAALGAMLVIDFPFGPNCGRPRGLPDCQRARSLSFAGLQVPERSCHSFRARCGRAVWRPSPPCERRSVRAPCRIRYSPVSLVTACGSPPLAATVQSNPRFSSSQLVKAKVFPSGDHAGENSPGMNDSGVSRLGLPLGKSMSQSLSIAWNAMRLPSGEAVCQRINFASNAAS